MKDVTYAVRSLARSPGFTLATILTLSIGIGAATAIYRVVDTILLQPLPFPGGDRLVRLIEWVPHPIDGRPPLRRSLNHLEFRDWRERSKTVEDAAAFATMAQRMVKTPDGAAGLWGAMVSGNIFALLQVRPLLGRTLTPTDENNPDVVVLSHATWQTHYHSDPAIVGQVLEFRIGALLAPRPVRLLAVVGVTAPDFEMPTGALDFMTPITVAPGGNPLGVDMLARLQPGVSLQAANEEAAAMGKAIRPPLPAGKSLSGPRFEYENVKDRTVAPLRPALRILLAAVVVVLLIVCANVANLLLARGIARQREIAVRLAVGASRGRILRQILTECALLAMAGGVLGALLGAAGVTMVRRLALVEAPGIFALMFGASVLPRAHEIAIDWRLFAIALSIAAASSVVIGMLPALHLSRTNHLQALGSRGSGSGRGASRLRAALTLVQLVMATVLLSGAGLLVHSFFKLSAFDKGYNPANVLAFNLLFPDQYSTPRKAEVIETLLGRFRTNPSVRAAGFARHGMLIGEELYIGTFVPPGKTLEEMRETRTRTRSVSDGYLTAMAVPVLQGREFLPTDTAAAPGVIVINRSAASRFFGGTNPIGQVMTWHDNRAMTQSPMSVVGVVEDVRQERATDPLVPEIFVDYRQYLTRMQVPSPQAQNEGAIGFLSFALRTTGDPAGLVPNVRKVIRSVDPNIGIDAIVPMERLEASARARERFYAVVLGMFAAVAALLAVIGVYGVLAYAVVQRTQEIGVRMALGAQRRQVLGLIMRNGLMLTMLGVTLGLGAAAAGARWLESMLFGVAPLDVATFTAVAAGFTLVAVVACYLPARRAATIDPVVALRVD